MATATPLSKEAAFERHMRLCIAAMDLLNHVVNFAIRAARVGRNPRFVGGHPVCGFVPVRCR